MTDEMNETVVFGAESRVTRGRETRLTLRRRRAIGKQLANASRPRYAEKVSSGAFGELGAHDAVGAITPDAGVRLFGMADVNALIGALGMQGLAIRLHIESRNDGGQQKGNDDQEVSHRSKEMIVIRD